MNKSLCLIIELYKKNKPVDHTERSIQALQIMARVSATDQKVAKTVSSVCISKSGLGMISKTDLILKCK